MKLSELFSELISFSRSEKRGITILLFLIVVLVVSKYYMLYNSGKVHYTKIYNQQETVFATENTTEDNYRDTNLSNSSNNLQNKEKVKFDPNKAGFSELLAAGFNRFAASNILKFRNMGGKFSKPADLLKIYGVDSTEFLKIAPYINIVEIQSIKFTPYNNRVAKTIQIIEINSADSLELISLPGIGAVLSARILRYRASLGGFYSKEQLREIFGMSDTAFTKIAALVIADTSLIQKIPLNTVTISTLKAHPYLNNSQANAIMRYRQMMHAFKTKEDLLDNYLISDETYWKIAPYLSL